ncbi:Vps16, N-terminal region-domain-containing protein [Chytridium lagenaria]|nr:Vps16, N-terminal region-domain-containing protein [Chytridium lagenaria]
MAGDTPPHGLWYPPLIKTLLRKLDIYDLEWTGIDLSKSRVACAPYGGPIAVVRDENKLLNLHQNFSARPIIQVFSCAGRLLEQYPVDDGKLVGMGWNSSENLVCVMENGLVVMYGLSGVIRKFSLGEHARESGVIDCKFWDSGLVALTGDLRYLAVADFAEPRSKLLADPKFKDFPHAWCVIPPQHSLSRHIEVLAAVGPQYFGPFRFIRLSPDGKFVAIFSADGRLSVVSTDFQRNLAEFSTSSKSLPLNIAWCGSDSVILHWHDIVLVIGPFGDWIKYSVDGEVCLFSEVDGIRLISRDRVSFLQRVPEPVESVFKVGSTTPGAFLYDAHDHFERKSPRADENVRSIRTSMQEAVEACLEAALNEFDTTQQKQLLKESKAASFGKAYLSAYQSARFVKTCELLRVLNWARSESIGIPITFSQYLQLGPEIFVNRLLSRNLHQLAFDSCKLLNLPSEKVAIDWACKKVERGCSKAVAKKAYTSGFTKLAIQLLEHETNPSYQVPLLLSMEEDENALRKSIESGDSDMVFTVLLHLKRKHPIAEFFRLLHGKSLAIALLEKFAKEHDVQLLKDFYYQDDRRVDRANVVLLENFEQTQLPGKLTKLRESQKIYSEEKEKDFEAKSVDDQVKLLQAQSTLEREIGQSFINLTVTETVLKCLELGHFNRAAKMKSDFKVPEKRFNWLKLRAIVQQILADSLVKTPATAADGNAILNRISGRRIQR